MIGCEDHRFFGNLRPDFSTTCVSARSSCRQSNRILEAKKARINDTGYRLGASPRPVAFLNRAAPVTCVVDHEAEVSQKPCQTAGWPGQVSPSDEAARTAPWRRSPDLPCRYSYRHRLSAAPALANPRQRNKPNLPELAWNHQFQCQPQPLARTCQTRQTKRTQFRLTFHLVNGSTKIAGTKPIPSKFLGVNGLAEKSVAAHNSRFTNHDSPLTVHEQ